MPFSNVKLFYAGHTTFSTPFCVIEGVIKIFQEFKVTLFVDLEIGIGIGNVQIVNTMNTRLSGS
jgi:hypothetical protein